MSKKSIPGATALLVKNISAHLQSIADLHSYSFVYNKNGESGYLVGEQIVPAKQFEKAHLIPLLKNQQFQNVSLDGRHLK